MGETEGEDVANTPSGENASGHIRRGLKVGRSLASRRHLRHPRKKSLHHEPVASRRIWQGDLKFGHCEWCFLRNALKVFITGDADAAETPSRLASKTKKRGPRPSRPVCRVGEITMLSITENLRESEYCVYRLPRAGPRSLAGMRGESGSGVDAPFSPSVLTRANSDGWAIPRRACEERAVRSERQRTSSCGGWIEAYESGSCVRQRLRMCVTKEGVSSPG